MRFSPFGQPGDFFYLTQLGLFSTLCDNFCLWNRETLTEKDFYDYFAEETISIGFVFTQELNIR
ncbi:MAG: hypothetical protein EWV84_08435 [Microcystis sp. M_QC_C_20170808_M3Col]|nr:MAG: hypothetical protein EWV84_08435 [Microcystis sp. M_QC_C_20170808_M3Col]